MPVHDWKRVDAGIFHDFHQRWIITICNSLNASLLPNDFYALAEQVAEGAIPDVVTLEKISQASDATPRVDFSGNPVLSEIGLAVLDAPPQTRYSHDVDFDLYAARATHVVVRHVSGDQVIGFIEIVSPGNKHSAVALHTFVKKLGAALRSGCHLMVIDLHPPTPRDPRGVHAKFWEDSFGVTAPGVDPEHPLGMAAYCSSIRPVAYFEPFAIGNTLIDMPIFLTPDRYVNVPLERTYMEAWQGVPRRWRQVIDPSGLP